jgi:filamentous hemagglutinin family protein
MNFFLSGILFVIYISLNFCSVSIAGDSNSGTNSFPDGLKPGHDSTIISHGLEENQYIIEGGQTHNKKVYFIFDMFNVHSNESVFFRDEGKTHTFALVTGDMFSYINGRINSKAGTFILANPNGIFFGENNYLDLAGNFYCTTASAIKYEDDSIYHLKKNSSIISCSTPESFVFSDRSKNIQGSAPHVSDGKTVTISSVGGMNDLVSENANFLVIEARPGEEYSIPDNHKIDYSFQEEFPYFETNDSILIEFDLWNNFTCNEKFDEQHNISRLEIGIQKGLLMIAEDLSFAAIYSNIADRLGCELIDDTKIRFYLEQGQMAFNNGSFHEAIHSYKNALEKFKPFSEGYNYTKLLMVDAYQQIGDTPQVENILKEILDCFKSGNHKNDTVHALFLCKLAELHCNNGKLEEAKDLIASVENIAASVQDMTVWAYIENIFGNIYASSHNFSKAQWAYNTALDYCRLASCDSLIKIKSLLPVIQLNRLKVMNQEGSMRIEKDDLYSAVKSIYEDRDGFQKVLNLLSLADLNYDANVTIKNAIIISKHLDKIVQSYARGFSGLYALKQKKYKIAVEETRHAIRLLESYNRPALAYQWQLQSGRANKALKKKFEAAKHFSRAIQQLKYLRKSTFFMKAEDSYQKMIRPVFNEMVELILSESIVDSDMINLAIQAMDTMKTTEIENYFFDECMSYNKVKKMLTLNNIPPETLLIYPVALKDKLILMIATSDHREILAVPVTYIRLKKTITRFIDQVKNPHEKIKNIKITAEKLYKWLIRPVEEAVRSYVAEIDALVIAPDDLLRTVPFDVLYDGSRFLIEKYPTALIPALSLTNMKNIRTDHSNILMAGLAEEAFPRLPFVKNELTNMKALISDANILLDKDFTFENLRQNLKKHYRYLLFATHSRFDHDSNTSYIDTYDQSLSFSEIKDMLEIMSNQGEVDIISLNSCETARGNRNAFLGMAGVALNSGARSVTASLWRIEDHASCLIIKSFYDGIINNNLTKAKAMQHAKLSLIYSKTHSHPEFWGPAVLIGNWL